jgi:hypothetical protein
MLTCALDNYGIVAIGLDKPNSNSLIRRRWKVLSDEVRPDRQFAVTSIDHYREANRARSSDVVQSV